MIQFFHLTNYNKSPSHRFSNILLTIIELHQTVHSGSELIELELVALFMEVAEGLAFGHMELRRPLMRAELHPEQVDNGLALLKLFILLLRDTDHRWVEFLHHSSYARRCLKDQRPRQATDVTWRGRMIS